MGDFKDSDGIEHNDEPLFSSFRFLSFRAVKKVNMSEIEKYKGTEITILYDKENKTVINYDRLQKKHHYKWRYYTLFILCFIF